MGWLLWIFFVWFMISRLSRRRRRWGGWGVGSGIYWQAVQSPHGPRWVMLYGPEARPVPTREPSARERREATMAELRRRYVADEISVEEYEAELDRVLRKS